MKPSQQDIQDYATTFGVSQEQARRDLEIEATEPLTDVDSFYERD